MLRRHPRRGTCPWPLLACLYLLLPGAAGAADPDLATWRAGPVRYIITGPEDRAFKRLTTDEERREFIAEFWERRDPTPGTPENELRDVFVRRIQEANALFNETTKQGWRTDRGRIYILLGPPDEQESDPMQKERRGQIRWIYRGAPTEQSAPNRIIAFREDPSGEYRLDTDPASYELTLPFATRSSLALGPRPEDLLLGEPGPTPTGIATDVAGMLLQPREEELIREIVATEEYPGRFPFLWRIDSYRSENGLTFVAINLGIDPHLLAPEADASALLPMARLEDLGGSGRMYDFVYRNPFVPAPDNAPGSRSWIFQAGQGLPPGRYRCYLGVVDTSNGDAVSRHEDVVVPAFPGTGLALSSLTQVRLSETLAAEDTAWPYKRPFELAGRRLVPRLDPAYRNGETFSLYFQIYGASVSPDGRRDLRVEYRFYVHQPDGIHPLGDPVIAYPTEQAVGWQFPLVGWPAAAFRLQVTVSDRLTGESVSDSLEFLVDG